MLWKELRPGSTTWDVKMGYEAIGKDPNSEYDEVSYPSLALPSRGSLRP